MDKQLENIENAALDLFSIGSKHHHESLLKIKRRLVAKRKKELERQQEADQRRNRIELYRDLYSAHAPNETSPMPQELDVDQPGVYRLIRRIFEK